jgi:hypothetical protein
MAQEVPTSLGSSPLLNPQITEINAVEQPQRIVSRGTGSVNFAQMEWQGQEPSNGTAATSDAELNIYWRSPASMIACFVLGTFMALGHHLYYNALKGDLVGNPDDQQGKLRSEYHSIHDEIFTQNLFFNGFNPDQGRFL